MKTENDSTRKNEIIYRGENYENELKILIDDYFKYIIIRSK